MKFTITIDCDDNGSLDVWSQKKGELTQKELKVFNGLKKKVIQVVKESAREAREVEVN